MLHGTTFDHWEIGASDKCFLLPSRGEHFRSSFEDYTDINAELSKGVHQLDNTPLYWFFAISNFMLLDYWDQFLEYTACYFSLRF